MLTPIPGMTHLKVVTPSPARPEPRALAASAEAGPELAARRHAFALVRVALEAVCGVRPLERLDHRRYAPPARRHIAAGLRAGTLRGPVRVCSFHTKDDGELHGLAVCAGRWFAYTARMSTKKPERLLTFRVL